MSLLSPPPGMPMPTAGPMIDSERTNRKTIDATSSTAQHAIETSIACCAVLLVASIVFLFVRSESIMGPAVGIGIPGGGLNNDMAMHLVDVDYLVDPSRPEPQSVINGYPLGPHSLVGTVVS